MNQRGRRQWNFIQIGTFHYQPEVFLQQVDHETGLEITLDHTWSQVGQLPWAGRAALDRFDSFVQVDSLFLGEHQGFANRIQITRYQYLVH